MTIPTTVTEWAEAAKSFGLPVTVLMVVLGVLWTFTTTRITSHEGWVQDRIASQDAKIDETDSYIRNELSGMQKQATEVALECADALRCNAEALKEFSRR